MSGRPGAGAQALAVLLGMPAALVGFALATALLGAFSVPGPWAVALGALIGPAVVVGLIVAAFRALHADADARAAALAAALPPRAAP